MISGRDLRFGLRLLGKQPGLTAIVALTLALGLGATSSILTVVEEVILSVLPYRAPEQLVVFECLHQQEGGEEVWPISHPDFLDWRSRSELFEDLAAYAGPRSFNLVAGERPEHIHGEMVSAGYFRLLGLEAVHGRVFTAEEDRRPGDQRVILVSHDFWRSRFGGREDLVGETLLLNGDSYEVVGIIEPGFRGLTDQAQLWLPVNAAGRILGARYVDRRRFRWLEVIGRLRPEVPLEQAQAEIDGITAGLEDSYGDSNTGVGVRLHPLDDAWFADLRTRLLLLLGAAGL
ncbi:MAG: hypothetical protein GY856_24110, partial [bacterium]|nr:hypothetical protein [bacterium]